MKSSKEWTEQALKETGDLLANADYYTSWAKQIQIDALKDAARICNENLKVIRLPMDKFDYIYAITIDFCVRDLVVKIKEIEG